MMLGFAFFLFVAYEFWRMDDPIPGYGRLAKAKIKLTEQLREERDGVMELIDNRYTEAKGQLERVRKNYADRRVRALEAEQERKEVWDSTKQSTDRVREFCEETFMVYRRINRDNRLDDEPTPDHWETQHKVESPFLEELVEIPIISHAEALRLDNIQGGRIAELRETLDAGRRRCRRRIDRLTEIEGA